MAKLTGVPQAFAADIFADDVDPKHELGELAFTPDGRIFRYVRAGAGAALVAGNLLQAEAEDTGEQDLAVAAAAIGALTVTTTTTVTVVANEYAGGYMLVTTSAGIGTQYRIASHPAATAATVVLTLEEPLEVALTTASRIDLVANIYNRVIQCPITPTGTPVGVAVKAITLSQYGWVQVGGVANVLAVGALTVGLPVVASNSTAGGVETITDGANELLPIVGVAVTGVATAECGAVRLQGLV